MSGTLYVVATPLGNLDDLSPRAAATLKQAAAVAAEDTRHTKTLLVHVGSHAELVSFHAHSPRSEEHTSELQSRRDLVCRLLLEKKKRPGIRSRRRLRTRARSGARAGPPAV